MSPMAPEPAGHAPPTRSLWISRPWIDLAIGCAGWSLPLLAIAYRLTGPAALALSTTFYSLALVVNYPHYMATMYRAYARGEWRRASRLHGVGDARVGRHRRGGARADRLDSAPLHGVCDVESVALLRSELRTDDHVRAARRPSAHAPAAADPQSGVLRLVLDAAGLVQYRAVIGSTGSLAGTAGFSGTARSRTRRWRSSRSAAASASLPLVSQRRGAAMTPPLVLLLTQGLWFVAPAHGQRDHRRGGAADALQLRRSRADAFGAVPVDHAVFREARARARLGRPRATGSP